VVSDMQSVSGEKEGGCLGAERSSPRTSPMRYCVVSSDWLLYPFSYFGPNFHPHTSFSFLASFPVSQNFNHG
jgi:hypothetical protein